MLNFRDKIVVSSIRYKDKLIQFICPTEKNNKFCKFVGLLFEFRIKRLSLWRSLLSSKWLFVLQVKPLNKRDKRRIADDYYPPPGYGIPPGYADKDGSDRVKYGLYLLPSQVVIGYALFSIIIPLVCFLPLEHKFSSFTPFLIYLLTLLTGLLVHRALVKLMMPMVLYDVCRKWPISTYRLFLGVPHDVYIHESDFDRQKNLFWQPDGTTDINRQPAEFSYKNNTLQEVILNMAIFELLFKRKQKVASVNDEDSYLSGVDTRNIRTNNWFYYIVSPVIVSYVVIFISMFIYFLFECSVGYHGCKSGYIFSYPTNFIIAAFVWIALVFIYAGYIQHHLYDMHNQIRNGYYNSLLEKVPQRLLDDLFMLMPDGEVIDKAIKNTSGMLRIAASIMFLGLLGAIEILSQVVC